MSTLKRCSRGENCIHPDGPWLSRDNFPKDRTKKDGLRSQCNLCRAVTRKDQGCPKGSTSEEIAQYRLRKEKIALRREQYPDIYERQKAYWRQYYLDNKQKRYQEIRKWRRSNPDSIRSYNAKSQAKKRGVASTLSADDIAKIYTSQGGRCWWCQKDVGNDYHIDHRIPLSRGGPNTPENVVISCPECNERKNTKLPGEWNGRLL